MVATAETQSEAELLKMTLAAHGFQAVVSPAFSDYPSVDFVEGVNVSVLAADEQAVRELLAHLKKNQEE